MVWYTGVDKDIYESGIHYRPQQKYLTTDYTWPTTAAPPAPPAPRKTGILATAPANSFYNSAGNAFGYGTPIEPGGSFGSYDSINYIGGLDGDVQQYGVGRQFEDPSASPIGETYSYRKKFPSPIRLAAGFIPFGNAGLDFLEDRMNANRDQPPGTYRIGFLDDSMKGYYDNLAGSGMLFEGPGGVKTLTGKNLTGKGYLEGQMELAKEFGFDTMTDEEIEDAIAAEAERHAKKHGGNKGFIYKQMLEASTVYKTNKAIEKNIQKKAEKQFNNEFDAVAPPNNDPNQDHDNDGVPNNVEAAGGSYDGGYHGAEGGFESTGSGNQGGGGWSNADWGSDEGEFAGLNQGGRVYLNLGGIASVLGTELDRREGLAKGGRIGFFQGALADTEEGKAMSPGTSASGGTHEGGYGRDDVPLGGGGEEPPIVVKNKNNLTVDSDWLTTSPSTEIKYTPSQWAQIMARLSNPDITATDDIDFEGQFTGGNDLINYGIDFTDEGVTGGNVGLNYGDLNLRATTDLDRYNLGVNYDKGPFFVSGNIDNMGNKNVMGGVKWSFGEPNQAPTRSVSYKEENPDLIYGQNLRHGGLASLL